MPGPIDAPSRITLPFQGVELKRTDAGYNHCFSYQGFHAPPSASSEGSDHISRSGLITPIASYVYQVELRALEGGPSEAHPSSHISGDTVDEEHSSVYKLTGAGQTEQASLLDLMNDESPLLVLLADADQKASESGKLHPDAPRFCYAGVARSASSVTAKLGSA